MVSRGFFGRRRPEPPRPIPPGQYLENGSRCCRPGPTPRTPLEHGPSAWWTAWPNCWRNGHGKSSLLCPKPRSRGHPLRDQVEQAGHHLEGVSFDTLLEAAGITDPDPYIMAFCDGGYTTNVPTADLLDGRGMVALEFDGAPLQPAHGGPAACWCPTSTSGSRPSGCEGFIS